VKAIPECIVPSLVKKIRWGEQNLDSHSTLTKAKQLVPEFMLMPIWYVL